MKEILINKFFENKDTIQSIIWRSLQVFGKQGITFLIFIISAKLLNPYDFGVYNYIIAVIFFLIMFSDFGISMATSKYVAEYNVTNIIKLKKVLFNSGIIILIFSIIITTLTIIFGPSYFYDKYIYALYLLPLVFLVPMTSLYDGIYRGLKKFKQLAIISVVIGLISTSFIYYLVSRYGLIGALISQNLFYLSLLVCLGLGYREVSFEIDSDVVKKIFKYSFILGIGGIGLFLYTRIDILFLGKFGYIKEIGYYEIINKVISFFLIPFMIISSVIATNITEYFTKGEYRRIKIKFKKYLLFSFILAIMTVIIFYFLSILLINNFFLIYKTPEMLIIIKLMSIVVFSQVVNGIIPVGFSLATGHGKLNTQILVIFGLLNTVLDYFFIIKFGFVGVIYATVVSKVSADLLFLFIYYRTIFKLKENILK